MCKILVIDTTVAYDSARIPNCTSFLESVLNNGYHAAMSPFILKEWVRCKTEFAFSWRGEMLSRGRLHITKDNTDEKLRAELEGFAPDVHCRTEMLKDAPLLETALEKDEIVISSDETVRKLYALASADICEISIIIWVNPVNEKERPLQWLKNGAEAELERQLGHLFDEIKEKRMTNKQEHMEDLVGFGNFLQTLE